MEKMYRQRIIKIFQGYMNCYHCW